MPNTWFQFPEWKTEENFQKEIYIETNDPDRPMLIKVDEWTWTFILKAKTSEKISKLILNTSLAWKIRVKTEDILIEN